MKRILPLSAAIITVAVFIISCMFVYRPPADGMTLKLRRSASSNEIMTGRDKITDPAQFTQLLPGLVVIDINSADHDLLKSLPGIGDSLADAIIEYRTQNGPFDKPEDIMNVKGIGESKFAALSPFITVSK